MLTGNSIQNDFAPMRYRAEALLTGLNQRPLPRAGRTNRRALGGDRIRHPGNRRLPLPFKQIRDELHDPLIERKRMTPVDNVHRSSAHVLAMTRHPRTILTEHFGLRVSRHPLVPLPICFDLGNQIPPAFSTELRAVPFDEKIAAVRIQIGIWSDAHKNKMRRGTPLVKAGLTGLSCRGLQSDYPR